MNSSDHGILLVEDDENDIFFTRRAIAKASLEPPIHVAVNGQDALDYLSGSGKYSDRATYPLPKCVLLDLKLPYVHGFQILEWVRAQSALKNLVIFVLTSSPEESDRRRAEQLGAAAYLIKPATAEMLSSALKTCSRATQP